MKIDFFLIEKTINNNFADAGITKFLVKSKSDTLKKIFIDNFKRHLALNIASMMQGYFKSNI